MSWESDEARHIWLKYEKVRDDFDSDVTLAERFPERAMDLESLEQRGRDLVDLARQYSDELHRHNRAQGSFDWGFNGAHVLHQALEYQKRLSACVKRITRDRQQETRRRLT